MNGSRSLIAAKLALSTALVMASTMMINVYVPATRGYFNLGECMIYLIALLFDPLTAAFAGGVGSALADIALGYLIYAPATLLIKAAEGAVASKLAKKIRTKGESILLPTAFLVVAGYFTLVLIIGYTIFAGEIELSLANFFVFKGFLSPIIWIPIAFIATLIPFYLTLRRRGEGLLIAALLLSGLVMISGYFIYEQLILGYYALAEVPANFGQAVLGTAVAIPLYKAIQKIRGR
ncbi:MAG TPA: hypothetical protein ENF33_01075 [Nitrososphaeria archaeon]|nr:hypothetical protein [Nitrososphaeria archaeon]